MNFSGVYDQTLVHTLVYEHFVKHMQNIWKSDILNSVNEYPT